MSVEKIIEYIHVRKLINSQPHLRKKLLRAINDLISSNKLYDHNGSIYPHLKAIADYSKEGHAGSNDNANIAVAHMKAKMENGNTPKYITFFLIWMSVCHRYEAEQFFQNTLKINFIEPPFIKELEQIKKEQFRLILGYGVNLQLWSPVDDREVSDWRTALDMHFTKRLTSFEGRKCERLKLQVFLQDKRGFLWWQISGDPGSGKSRLALKMADTYADDYNWQTGLLEHIDEHFIEKLKYWKPQAPTLILIDDVTAKRDAKFLPILIQTLAIKYEEPSSTYPSVRLLITDRQSYISPPKQPSESLEPVWQQYVFDRTNVKSMTYSVRTVFAHQALSLQGMKPIEIFEIAKCWATKVSETEVTVIQYKNIKKVLELRCITDPLTAILIADVTIRGNIKNINDNTSFETIVSEVLDIEHRLYFADEIRSLGISPSSSNIVKKCCTPLQQNLAVFINLVGEISIKQLKSRKSLRFNNATDHDIVVANKILGRDISEEKLTEATMVSCRSPDLIREYQILRMLENEKFLVADILSVDLDQQSIFDTRLKELVSESRLNFDATIANFVSDIACDFPSHSVTPYLLEASHRFSTFMSEWLIRDLLNRGLIDSALNIRKVFELNLVQNNYSPPTMLNYLKASRRIEEKIPSVDQNIQHIKFVETINNFENEYLCFRRRPHAYTLINVSKALEAKEKNDRIGLMKSYRWAREAVVRQPTSRTIREDYGIILAELGKQFISRRKISGTQKVLKKIRKLAELDPYCVDLLYEYAQLSHLVASDCIARGKHFSAIKILLSLRTYCSRERLREKTELLEGQNKYIHLDAEGLKGRIPPHDFERISSPIYYNKLVASRLAYSNIAYELIQKYSELGKFKIAHIFVKVALDETKHHLRDPEFQLLYNLTKEYETNEIIG